MRKPNFFIIGAPRCGTDSLYTWLSAHRNIGMSPWKEPNYFNDDHNCTRPPTLEDYLRLFRRYGTEQKAVGESSVWYFYSKTAVTNILRFQPEARFIVCLRNPLEMAPSLHAKMVLYGEEPILDFEMAWNAQADRATGGNLPGFCRNPTFLQYGEVCSLGKQLERLYARVPKDRVLPLLLDDTLRDTRNQYLRVMKFLEVPDDGRIIFEAYNASAEPRSLFLAKAIRIAGIAKRKLGIRRLGLGILTNLEKVNFKVQVREKLESEFISELAQYFSTDVDLLGRLLGRDLSDWLKV